MASVRMELYSSSFCAACRQTRRVLSEAVRLLPAAEIVEFDVAHDPDRAELHHIDATPTVIIHDAEGAEVYRASGVPTTAQVLVAAAKALKVD